jgi:uncharacterized protein (UPF0332 family)
VSTENALQRARRYLDTAALVLNDGDFESAVSRAYYAMFYVARALLEQKDITPKTHSGLRNQFGLHFVKTGDLPERFAAMLNNAEDLRNLAEYAEERIITREDAEITLREAREFVERVRELLNA